MKSTTVKIIFVYLLLCLIWGSTWMGIRASLESLTPFISSGIRFIVASVGIFIVMRFKGMKLQRDRLSVTLYIVMGVFSFIVAYGLVYWAEQFVPSGLAAVLFAVYPFFVAIFSYFFIPGEKIGIYKSIGMIFGFFGIVVIFSDSFTGELNLNLAGMLAVVLSGVIQAAIAVLIKKKGGGLNSFTMNFIPMLIAGIGLTLIGLIIEDLTQLKFDSTAIISVSYLAIFGSIITFTSFYWLMKKVNIIILSLTSFITPVVAVFVGWLFYREQLTQENIIGAILVLIGLIIANAQSNYRVKKLA